jgi:hypothetical protein
MKIATVSVFAAATIGSTVALKGSTPPVHHPAAGAAQQERPAAEAPSRKAP